MNFSGTIPDLECFWLRARDWITRQRVRPFTPLRESAVVLRIHRRKKPFFRPEALREPDGEAYKPNTGDIEEAVKRGRPVGVSVFDSCRTSFAQAVAIRESMARGAPPPEPWAVLRISAKDVRRIAREATYSAEIVTDPLCAEDGKALNMVGAHGHCVIEGLHEPDKARRRLPAYKNMLDKLAEVSSVGPEVAGTPRP